jgi:hypothetical protein
VQPLFSRKEVFHSAHLSFFCSSFCSESGVFRLLALGTAHDGKSLEPLKPELPKFLHLRALHLGFKKFFSTSLGAFNVQAAKSSMSSTAIEAPFLAPSCGCKLVCPCCLNVEILVDDAMQNIHGQKRLLKKCRPPKILTSSTSMMYA